MVVEVVVVSEMVLYLDATHFLYIGGLPLTWKNVGAWTSRVPFSAERLP